VLGHGPVAGKVPAMTLLLAPLNSGGTDVADSGMFWTPYLIGGGILLLLLVLMTALLAFGKGREHS
jgi:hypothetical protein